MKITEKEKDLYVKTEDAYTMLNYLEKEETIRLVRKALDDSKKYTDYKIKISERKSRREERVIRKSNMIAKISIVLAFIGAIIVAMSESTVKSPDYSSSSLIMILQMSGVVLLAGSLASMFIAEYVQDSFYKTLYTIHYKTQLGHTTNYEEYSTRATSAAKAIARFYSLTDMKYKPYKIIDEFGTSYNNDGIPEEE